MRAIVSVVLLAAACGSKAPDPKPAEPTTTAAPITASTAATIAFGDCAGPTVAFVSGAKPMPFTPDEASGVPDDPPPPEVDAPAPTGSDRAEGQYKMMKVPDDPQLARAQAIEQARRAGLLDDASPELAYGGTIGNEVGEQTRPALIRKHVQLGHGAGTGTSGPGARRPADRPIVSFGVPSTNGDLDKAIIRRAIKQRAAQITYCYEKVLLSDADLHGTVMVQFFISPDGAVASSSGAGVSTEVASCVANVVKSIEFPKPKGGGGVQVNYPFDFSNPYRAQQGRAEPPPAKYGEPSVTAVLDIAAGVHSPFRDADWGPVDPTTYKPGAASPLRAQAAAIAACVKSVPYGAAVVALPGGEVTGLADASARACVAAAAKTIASPAPQRCTFAFGVMPDADRPTIAIAAKAIALDGKPVGDLPAADLPRIPALVDALLGARTAAVASPALAMFPPLALHPEPDAPIAALLQTITTIVYVDRDFTLARKTPAGAWQPLGPAPALPTVPVPLGTAGRFMPLVQFAIGSPSDKPYASLFVMRDRKARIGVSKVNEFVEIDAGPDLQRRLADALAVTKKRADFAHRTDLEIALDPSLTYADLLVAIDAAVAAGFTDWRITYAQALTAQP